VLAVSRHSAEEKAAYNLPLIPDFTVVIKGHQPTQTPSSAGGPTTLALDCVIPTK